MPETTTAPVTTAAAATTEAVEDDWLTGAVACSIENGEDCEACQ